MSYLGNFLQRHLEATQMSQRELAAQLGLTVSHMSRILRGERKWLNMQTIDKMLQGISREWEVRAGLMQAYLWDQCPESAYGLIKVASEEDAATKQLQEDSPPYGAKFISQKTDLSPRLVKILQKLGQTANGCPELMKVLEDLSKLEIKTKRG